MTTASEEIKLAVIGCGAVTQARYLPAANLVPNLAITHIVDLDVERGREVANRFGVALCTVQRWVERAKGRRLNRVDWSSRSRAPKRTGRTKAAIEQQVLTISRWLKDQSILGEYGAAAIRREMEARKIEPCPSIPTIGRILQRRGVLDGRKRTRHPAPPLSSAVHPTSPSLRRTPCGRPSSRVESHPRQHN